MLWDQTLINDEIWLRVRRVLIDELERAGFELDPLALRDRFGEERQKGRTLLAEAGEDVGPDWVESLAGEQFLGAGARRFQLRLPLILAFGGSYAEALTAMTPELPESQARRLRRLSALFNLGIVLVDAIMDDPERFGDVRPLLGSGAGPTDAGRHAPGDTAAAPSSPELATLGRLVDRFFAGVAALGGGRRGPERERLDKLLTEAYASQLASVASPERPERARAKSVNPFLVAPALVDIALDPGRDLPLQAIALDIGEGFWRIDDLIDAARDFRIGEPNLLAARLGPCGQARLSVDLLQSELIEEVAREAIGHFAAAIGLASDNGLDSGPLRGWITTYACDWLR